MTDTLTVLVKKADGTFERRPLSSLKKKVPISAPIAPVVEKKMTEEKKEVIREKKSDAVLMLPSLAEEKLLPSPPANPDFSSPLEEIPPTGTVAPAAVANARTNQVDMVMKKISFTVGAGEQNRLRTLVQLLLKDVRTAEQTRERAMDSVPNGGLGITAAQADELIAACGKAPAPVSVPVAPLKKSVLQVNEKSVALPFVANEDNVVMASVAKTPSFKLASVDRPKAVMQDVAPRPREFGPIDVLRSFSLVEFRRLSANPAEAGKRLQQKFVALKEESYLFFLQALSAWHESPLFVAYMELIRRALHEGKTVQEVAGQKDMLRIEEVKAIVEMEKGLRE